jgi:hypothetical protein
MRSHFSDFRLLVPHASIISSALERKRTSTSIPLAEERQILYEINGIKKTKSKVEEYHSMEKQVQETKVRGQKLQV